jgi:uncharacterized protein YecE (DUF72 family)
MVRFGPAGWAYPDWKTVVYPAPAPRGFDPLAYLARYFSTVEVDSTFYGPARARVAEGWAERALQENPRFRFSAKLWRRFTHERDLAFTAAEVEATAAAFRALLGKGVLGAVVVQFPWSFRNEEKNREWLRQVLHAFAEFPLVVEVRHLSWNVADFFAGLVERGVGFVNVDQPLFKNSMKPGARATAAVGYVRIHGRNFRDWFRAAAGRDERYDYLYTAEELRPWAERIRTIAESTTDLYAVTNNHFLGKAPANALMLESMFEGQKVRAPPRLFERYEEALAPFAEPDGHEAARPGLGR